ncbi:MAG: YkgJ family cysteine cluster protein [Smithella sp.]|jgi:Fe-S-cluster containining protein
MKNESEEKKETPWDCFSFPCGDSCCQHGADVFAHERDSLIAAGKATAADFLQPKTDKTGTTMYRTRVGARGCVFLLDERGCRLHIAGHKPSVCREWPRTFQEAKRAASDNYLPCFPHRYTQKPNHKNKSR